MLLDKPGGMTSRQAGWRVAKLFEQKKFGHIGTLDPMASGLLIIALGEATKMIPYMDYSDTNGPKSLKCYLFDIKWGVRTDTDDITGKILEGGGRQTSLLPTEGEIAAALPQMMGIHDQMPPAFSAKKLDGVPAYKLARAGKTPELKPNRIEILHLIAHDGAYCMICTKGTYVRSVVRDLAAKLGTIATTSMIRRVETNGIGIEDAATLETLENNRYNAEALAKLMRAPDFGLDDIPVTELDINDAELFKNGCFLTREWPAPGLTRIYSNGKFLGLGIVEYGILKPKRIINVD